MLTLAAHGASSTEERTGWRLAAWLMAAVFTAGVCYSLLRIPIQTTDAIVPLLAAQRTPSVRHAILDNVTSAAYLRPLRIAQIQILFELSRGRYFLAYKSFHVLLVLCCVGVFVLILDPRTRTDFAAMSFALTTLTGLHTFLGTVWEAYPINHFLEIAVFCLATFALARSKGGWWADLIAAAIFIVGIFTLESGLLVWVVAVAGWLLGMRGISVRGIVVMTILLGGYLVLRFGYLPTGLPTLIERSSGFGTTRLDPDELIRRFGDWPYGFYAYNVAASFVSVLLSEPRAGVWEVVGDLSAGKFVYGTFVNLISSAITTAAIGWYAMRRWATWRRREFTSADQVVLVALAVLIANAVISYGYTKDEIMSPAGVFYALAVFVAIAEILRHITLPFLSSRRVLTIGVLLLIAAGGWSLRSLGLHYRMHQMAFNVRNEWVDVYAWLERQEETPRTEAARQIVDQLRADALEADIVNPTLLSPPGRQFIR